MMNLIIGKRNNIPVGINILNCLYCTITDMDFSSGGSSKQFSIFSIVFLKNLTTNY